MKRKKKAKHNPKGPIRQKEDVQTNPDRRIDQDFPGYPYPPSKEEIIKPETGIEKKIAGLDIKDGEKRNYPPQKNKKEIDDGSANAFERTETVPDDE